MRLINLLTGATTGEIVVGSAQSDAAFVRVSASSEPTSP
jgi:hypothetical protein